jgi:hypothetical protein
MGNSEMPMISLFEFGIDLKFELERRDIAVGLTSYAMKKCSSGLSLQDAF